MTVGERIKERREALSMTQTTLADTVGTTKQNIYKYENGIITNIPSDKVEAIAVALNTTPAYLMGWDDIAKYLKEECESGRDEAKERMFQVFGAEHSTRSYHIVNDRKVALLYYHPFSKGYDASVILDVINMMEDLNTEELETVRSIVRGYVRRHDEEE